jgi:hypothetical protein
MVEFQRRHGQVNYSFLKTFGCEAFVHIDKENRTKLEEKSRSVPLLDTLLMILVIAYGIMKITKSLGVEMSYSMRRSCTKLSCRERNRKKKNQNTQVLDEITGKEIPKEPENQNVQQQEKQVPQTPASVVRRSTRLSIPPERYSPSLYYLLLTDSGEPECYEEAMQVDTKKKWEQGMKEEIDSLVNNQTWDFVQFPAGKRALQNKWVYKLKEEDGGENDTRLDLL